MYVGLNEFEEGKSIASWKIFSAEILGWRRIDNSNRAVIHQGTQSIGESRQHTNLGKIEL